MPSTYTSGIRLEQPADGEQAASWGDTVNRDLSLIDNAISGITEIVTSGGIVALSAMNGEADQARAAIIQLTGSLQQNLNLVFPANYPRIIHFRNLLVSNGFSLIIQCAGGTGGPVLPGNWGGVFFTDGLGVDNLSPTSAFNEVGISNFLTAGALTPIEVNQTGTFLASGYLEMCGKQGDPVLQLASQYSASVANSGILATFFGNGTTATCGSITSTGTTAAYNTTSDYRAKKNVRTMRRGIERLMQLRPCRGVYRADPLRVVDMLIAHEVARVVPEAVHGRKDAVDDKGKPVLQQLDHSKLVPVLVAALQEAVTRIERLERRAPPRKSWLRVLLGL